MGFKKQGISIMFLFWGVFAIGACTGMDWLVFLIPIMWNLKSNCSKRKPGCTYNFFNDAFVKPLYHLYGGFIF